MKIKFLGAAGTVTGSSYVLTSGSGQSILIDLGMFQGPDVDHFNYQPFDYDCSTLSGVLLTHAHLDHCGRLPILLKNGFTESIWMTSATADLTELSLLDSAKIAKEDGKPILFDKALAILAIQRFKRVHYRSPFTIGDFTITMRDAGHILGSASLEIEDTKHDSPIRKIVFSGDLGNSPDNLLPDIETIASADAVVMESTYGDRLHPSSDPMDVLASEINAVEATGGTLLIPAFSLHRTQELMHMIMHLKQKGTVRQATPVFMDSPMGNAATAIYTRYPGDFNVHVQREFRGTTPFEFPGVVIIQRRKGQHLIDTELGAKVIIAGSGMMTGGKIIGHAAKYLPIPSTRLLIVGWQGVGTLGRELLEGSRKVTIDGSAIEVKASVTDTQAMSSHADQGQLMHWLKFIKKVQKVFLTHGDDGPRAVLAKKITKDLGIADVTMPTLHQEVTV
ncbi:MAG: MBL fold metallo-hydrolase [Patescibacteria group bacterium]